ncbi:unnamed protein product, partial [Rotaria socialis]
MGSSNKNWS